MNSDHVPVTIMMLMAAKWDLPLLDFSAAPTTTIATVVEPAKQRRVSLVARKRSSENKITAPVFPGL